MGPYHRLSVSSSKELRRNRRYILSQDGSGLPSWENTPFATFCGRPSWSFGEIAFPHPAKARVVRVRALPGPIEEVGADATGRGALRKLECCANTGVITQGQGRHGMTSPSSTTKIIRYSNAIQVLRLGGSAFRCSAAQTMMRKCIWSSCSSRVTVLRSWIHTTPRFPLSRSGLKMAW
jgi:hypothetical protein